MLAHGLNCPPTTSCGRLFDAAAALLGVRTHNRFEGEAAMALEALCSRPRVMDGGWRIDGDALDLSPLMDRLAGLGDARDGADLFHGTLAAALADFTLDRLDAPRLALTGGCIANRPLTEALAAHFATAGVETLIPQQAPPGDGGLSLGQALIARRKLQEAN
jgi:hydrogenase maturation protein HypF